ncbi:Protein toll, partial [Stegodyphus mimosarum]
MNSKRVIILLSQNYINDPFCMQIFRTAFASNLEERMWRIILIIEGELPPASELDQSLRAVIKSTKCLRFSQRLFWEMLRYAMPTSNVQRHTEDNPDVDLDIPLLN